MLNIKEVIVRIRLAGSLILRNMVILIGTGVLKANNLNNLSKFGVKVILTDIWARGVLKSMVWVKIKGTTGKVES